MGMQRAPILQIAVLSLTCRDEYLLPVRLFLQADQPIDGQALLFLRGMVGVGLGGAHVPVALYLEFVPTNLRGVMLVALQSFWTIGTMIEVPAHGPSSKSLVDGFTPHASRAVGKYLSYVQLRYSGAMQAGCHSKSQAILMAIKMPLTRRGCCRHCWGGLCYPRWAGGGC